MEEIRIQSFVTAAPERVWDVLLGRPEVVLDALPVRAWPERRTEERPSRLRLTWPFGAGAGSELEIGLDPLRPGGPLPAEAATAGDGTRVDLRHGGWESGTAEDVLAGHFAGWLQALAALGLLVETGKDARASAALAGSERYYASGEIPSDADAVYRALTDPGVLARWSRDALADAELQDVIEGRYARWSLAARSGGAPASAGGELVMILRPTPRGTHCAVAEYGVVGRSSSARWPAMLERLAQFLR